MSLSIKLEEIRAQLQNGHFTNEAAICHGVLLPVLYNLGWPVFNSSVVLPQFSLGNKRVEYALCNSFSRPTILVEVKGSGKLEVVDPQLFEYATNHDVPIAIFTDGKDWHFYLASEKGEYLDRRFNNLDLIDKNSKDTTEFFERYLKYDRVVSEEALEAARTDYQAVLKARKISNAMTQAWDEILEEPDEILLKLLAEKVDCICGLRPDLETCSEYIRNIYFQSQLKFKDSEASPVSEKLRQRSDAAWSSPSSTGQSYTLEHLSNMDLVNTKPSFLQIAGQQIRTRNWADLCTKFVDWLINKGHLTYNRLPIYNSVGKNKYFVNLKPEHQSREKDGSWKQVGNYFVDVKYNASRHVLNIIYALQHLNLCDLDVRIAFSKDIIPVAETSFSNDFYPSFSDEKDDLYI